MWLGLGLGVLTPGNWRAKAVGFRRLLPLLFSGLVTFAQHTHGDVGLLCLRQNAVFGLLLFGHMVFDVFRQDRNFGVVNGKSTGCVIKSPIRILTPSCSTCASSSVALSTFASRHAG